LAISAIVYFILIKGINGSAFAEMKMASGERFSDWVATHTGIILLYNFIFWVIILQLLSWLFKIKILKLIVLVGTFALAMAFAGNDLVNFIGVPLAGFNSFKAWVAGGAGSPDEFTMEMLAGKVDTPTFMLAIAGLIMIVTLILSKKAQSVVTTSVDLSRQSEGSERFNSSLAARVIVRGTTKFNRGIRSIMPSPMIESIQSRFTPPSEDNATHPDAPAFDKIRAAVNLVVASILIAIGTSLKLPLSTTYVTFMVAMGTSLSDRAWDRESAVYRVSGVFSVIGGWFLTAILAFTVSAIIASLISVGGQFMIFIFVAVAIFMVIRTHMLFKKRSRESQEDEEESITEKDATDKVMEKCIKQVSKSIVQANTVYDDSIKHFLKENRSKLKEALEVKDNLNKKAKKKKNKVLNTLSKIEENVDSGHFYVQVVDYQRELAHSLNFLSEPLFDHLDNQHKPFIKAQAEEMQALNEKVDHFFNFALTIIKENKFNEIENLIKLRDKILQDLEKMEIAQIKRIKAKEVNTRNSMLFFNTITETKNMLLHAINLIKSHRDFITVTMKDREKAE
ncbi:MAG: inorganic phosphate transporter, partial [Bacteroidota bacterium]